MAQATIEIERKKEKSHPTNKIYTRSEEKTTLIVVRINYRKSQITYRLLNR